MYEAQHQKTIRIDVIARDIISLYGKKVKVKVKLSLCLTN
jgi:hypothetical protein